MAVPDLFDRAVAGDLIARLSRLTPQSEPLWGTMTVGQMLAHCSKPFETVYDPAYERENPRPNVLLRGLLRLIAKPIVVGEKPYRKNSRTAPSFVVTGDRDVEEERARLTAFIEQALADGAAGFEGRESHSFGPLTAREWSTLFYKHTDHHLGQFGV